MQGLHNEFDVLKKFDILYFRVPSEIPKLKIPTGQNPETQNPEIQNPDRFKIPTGSKSRQVKIPTGSKSRQAKIPTGSKSRQAKIPRFCNSSTGRCTTSRKIT